MSNYRKLLLFSTLLLLFQVTQSSEQLNQKQQEQNNNQKMDNVGFKKLSKYKIQQYINAYKEHSRIEDNLLSYMDMKSNDITSNVSKNFDTEISNIASQILSYCQNIKNYISSIQENNLTNIEEILDLMLDMINDILFYRLETCNKLFSKYKEAFINEHSLRLGISINNFFLKIINNRENIRAEYYTLMTKIFDNYGEKLKNCTSKEDKEKIKSLRDSEIKPLLDECKNKLSMFDEIDVPKEVEKFILSQKNTICNRIEIFIKNNTEDVKRLYSNEINFISEMKTLEYIKSIYANIFEKQQQNHHEKSKIISQISQQSIKEKIEKIQALINNHCLIKKNTIYFNNNTHF